MSTPETRIAIDGHLPNSNSATSCGRFGRINEAIDNALPSTSGLATRIYRKFEFSHTEERNELPSPLHSLDDLSQKLLEQKLELDGGESYLTVDLCAKEVATCTEFDAVLFSRNPRTQDAITRSNFETSPPPPYSYNDNYRYQGQAGSTPVYQEVYVGSSVPPPPRDAQRAPPYQVTYTDSFEVLNPFTNRKIRNRFVQRVYTILSIQLLLAFGFVAACVYVEPLRKFVVQNFFITIIAAALLFILEIVLFCYQAPRKIFPINFCLLFLLTVAMSYVVGAMACLYSKEAVLLAVGVTLAMCLVITFVAWQNWFDVTTWGMVLCIMSVVLIIYGIIAIIITLVTGSNIAYIIYACLATLLFCFYLLYDTQQILGGGRIALSPEEYILGAICLFIDIMTIFMSLLYLFGQCRN